jgi:hypothetical protein
MRFRPLCILIFYSEINNFVLNPFAILPGNNPFNVKKMEAGTQFLPPF